MNHDERLKPDWGYWAYVPVVSMHDACLLSFNVNPKGGNYFEYDLSYGDFDERLERRIEIAKANHPCNGGGFPVFENEGQIIETKTRLPEFGAWAKSMGWELPKEFPIREVEQEALFSFGDYPDMYPEELDIAVQAWRAVAVNGYGMKAEAKERIRDWLDNNYPSLSGSARERISTVCNWDKKGGNKSSSKGG